MKENIHGVENKNNHNDNSGYHYYNKNIVGMGSVGFGFR
jgi:hypothetical protein